MGNRLGLFILGVGALLAVSEASAQSYSVSVTATPNPVIVNNTITYTLLATNRTSQSVTNLFVTNRLSSTLSVLDTSNPSGAVFPDGNVVVFRFNTLGSNGMATATLRARPAAAGFATNTVTYLDSNMDLETLTVVSTVNLGAADLVVAIQVPSTRIVAGDWIAYAIFATNRGPNTAPSAVLSNLWSTGVSLVSIQPSPPNLTVTDAGLRIPLGDMPPLGTAQFLVRAQFGAAGMVPLTAWIGSSGVNDTNLGNNTMTRTAGVDPPGDALIPRITSSQVYRPQTGLMNQSIQLSNGSPAAVASARLILSNFPHRVHNAVGTNFGAPFVLHTGPLAVGETVDLTLEYFNPARVPGPNPDLIAYGVAAGGSVVSTNNALAISRVVSLNGGRLLIEFQAVPGRSYAVLYSDQASFTNARAAQPTIQAPANRVQWVDEGPPKTLSRPGDVTSRFYRVIQLDP